MSKKGSRMAITLYEWAHHILPKYIDCRPVFLTEILEAFAFRIIDSRIVTMWGLPVEIVLASK
jgi:demethylmenaquinone methyltransferase/2-methoxy-6-polyprenyl-1,4-benzoquinol methylase